MFIVTMLSEKRRTWKYLWQNILIAVTKELKNDVHNTKNKVMLSK